MVFPHSWRCPTCNSAVYNSPNCTTCHYAPPIETKEIKNKESKNLLKERIVAFLIDFIIIIGIGLVISIALIFSMPNTLDKDLIVLMLSFGIPITLSFAALHPVYFIILEGGSGLTVGKKIMKIKVSEVGFKKSLLRNITRFIEDDLNTLFHFPIKAQGFPNDLFNIVGHGI